ncbi:MAG TPA: DUF1294 domain-containing protein [Flavobacterium sp.]|jgi:uncharacterized membrane protein YsdA (DUF1294 family)|uniref:DUF1294 domain-containing protein n=1 Tax=Flavobacterium sp. TaxID=239 RepID=UPI001B6785A5|nr:DUF1294 domain-containing protein [Flavobacterium sp.]MBP7181722.1 DUF1294 domain-containing protein [Flavobacterium sp.]MBP7318469.1 DUF1294 domain-containing protein [Flavobacterium sp.]HRL70941.1 DUF1294 domain-containing protein [Flavobacterium sp.]HRM11409.1 DUF1294 domain-containing protein [Flavobacterium sp.]HRM45624.1 DUF1294 domain-containing protein [Flavobacterium sp.]
MTILFYCFLIINGFAFVLTGYDKRLAVKNKRRISEKTLLSFVGFGGIIGAGIAMLIFRHKTAKRSYLLKFFGILLIQVLCLFLFINSKA